jgi:hypothetical protein
LASYGFRNALGFHDNEIASYRVFKETLQNQAMIDIMNAGYIIYDGDKGTGVQKNPGDLGRARLYYNFEAMENQEKIIQKLRDNDFDYRNVLLLEAKNLLPLQEGNGILKIVNAQMDKLEFEVESSQNALLFVSENFHKFWRAKVNGKDTQIYRAFSTFMAVEIPSGKSAIELVYISNSLRKSLVLSAIGFGILIFAIIIYVMRGRNEKSLF